MMNDISQRIAALSPEQRALFELRLKKKSLNYVKTQSIPKRKDPNFLPLSFHQQVLWFLHQLDPDSPVYNIPVAILLEGVVNVKALEQSLNQIRQRHEVLQTHFLMVEGQPVQEKVADLTLELPVIDLHELPESNRQQLVQELAKQEAQRPFDISQEALLRVKLLRLCETQYVMLFTMHHIVSDAWSRGVIIRELAALYTAICCGQPSPLPELPIQYADFVAWQREWLQGEVLESQLSYWKKQLGDKLPVINLPTDKPRPDIQTFRGAKRSLILPESLNEQLRTLSQQQGVTLFTTLLAGFYILLNWYTGQEDIVVGTDVANRNYAEIEGLIGFFINQLVLRTNLSGNPTFQEFLIQVREVALGAYDHQHLPFQKLVEALNPERDLSRAPLFQVKFVLQNFPMQSLEFSDLKVTFLDDIDNGTASLDLYLAIVETNQSITAILQYNTDLFTSSNIDRFLLNFETILKTVVIQPESKLIDINKHLTLVNKQQAKFQKQEKQASAYERLKQIKRKEVFIK
ncbi:non-ribosomal peptide synthase [Cylindrospermum stagnale PCC 7417]|uniref:Non-ribosomal peptide synthase n=1 Tax=Cylindrospermum stagnale PCC 7417 TaxID=56107 RepID=K9WVJ2_9NOST|nr:condensation domain-containing protein [Cylindrospermum stagnale]AFZ23806.1 non-ribosomal peptide synthase [Cylindrospermum stagnale PCC 7417]